MGRRPRLPSSGRQAERLNPQFQRLHEAMEHRRLALQDNSLGIQPELVLVLETIGSIENFINAVRHVKGLEWLGEFERTGILPDEDFQDEDNSQKHLNGQLFLVMSDQRALRELQGLFDSWKVNSESKFRRGLAPLKHAFEHLQTIRPWSADDRIRETGIFESWQLDMQDGPDRLVPFAAELWFRNNEHRRQRVEEHVREIIVQGLGGEVVQQCVIPEISYHAVLGRIPAYHVSEIIARREVRLLQCEDMMYLRPVGHCTVPGPSEDSAETKTSREDKRSDLPHDDPVVALFDGLPLTGHHLLDGRLVVDDPDGYESGYQARDRVHGTAMASLVCHGELDEEGWTLSRPVYIRPILQPRRGFDGQAEESIPENVLPVDLVHRSVRRLYENEGDELPAAPSVRVINLSVCDRSRPFVREMSSWARLLDWLAWKYNILFIVSAGNHENDIILNVPRIDLRRLAPEARREAVVKAIDADTRNRRLLSPAETLNGLTIGADHADASTPVTNHNLFDPYEQIRPTTAPTLWSPAPTPPPPTSTKLPSTFSAHGPGYRRSIKPDVCFPGGRQFLSERLGHNHTNVVLQTPNYASLPGQCVATPGTQGQLDRTQYTRGTSNAAALASRGAGFIHDVIEQMRTQPGVDLPPQYDAVLIKALLVHGADWSDNRLLYESILKNHQNTRIFAEYVTRFLGYGSADIAKVVSCTEQRVTVLGFGELNDAEGNEFAFPIPPSLSARGERRRLTITLAWFTPINSRHQNYRIAHLWFDPANNLAPKRICADHRAVQRGTVQHEVMEGNKVVLFDDGDVIRIKVNCRADAGDITEPVRYGLAVTLEIAESVNIPLYQEVRERLAVRIPVGAEGSI